MQEFTLTKEFIELDKLLKTCGIADTGGQAHAMVDEGMVMVNGVREYRRRYKVRSGAKVTIGREVILVRS